MSAQEEIKSLITYKEKRLTEALESAKNEIGHRKNIETSMRIGEITGLKIALCILEVEELEKTLFTEEKSVEQN